jgi:ubiquinone/menaquinone biosynthesis C-methylase UbiE
MKKLEKTFLSAQEISAAYDRLFETRGALRDSDIFYRWVLNQLAPHPGQRLLDVACGEGILLKFARAHGLHPIGIDLSPKGAQLAQAFVEEKIISIANGEALPFADGSFDLVTNLGSLEHFLQPIKGVQEICRVMDPGGLAAIFLPNSYYLVDIVWHVMRTGYSVSHRQPLENFATFREWWDFLESGGLRVIKAIKYNYIFPRSTNDWQWFRQHPRKLLNLLAAPFIPFNLSNHFLYICRRAPLVAGNKNSV